MNIMGVDMGTSGCKVVVFDTNWNVVSEAYREYPAYFPEKGLLELDAKNVWNKIKDAIKEANSKLRKPVNAVAVSAIGDAIIPCKKDGTPIRNSILDFDPRGEQELLEYVKDFGRNRFFEISGIPPLYIGSLAKILWYKKNEPETFKNTKYWATYEDFIVKKLGLKPCVSYSSASRTMLFDIRKKEYSKEMLDPISLDASYFAQPVPSAQKLGTINKKTKEILGFEGEVHVVSGGHDVVCAAVGCGLDENHEGVGVDVCGTMEVVIVVLKELNTSAVMLKNLFPCYPAQKAYVSFSLNLTAGSIVRWYRDMLSYEKNQEHKKNGTNYYDEMVDMIDETKPGGLMFLPHFSGSGNPYFNADAKGVIYGLVLNTTKQDIARALFEGLCYDLKLHCEAIKNTGVELHTLRAVGGGSRHDRQLQLKANVTGLKIIKSSVKESSAMGVAAYAAVGMGLLDNPADAYRSLKIKEKVFLPDEEAVRRFDKIFNKYKNFKAIINDFEIS